MGKQRLSGQLGKIVPKFSFWHFYLFFLISEWLEYLPTLWLSVGKRVFMTDILLFFFIIKVRDKSFIKKIGNIVWRSNIFHMSLNHLLRQWILNQILWTRLSFIRFYFGPSNDFKIRIKARTAREVIFKFKIIVRSICETRPHRIARVCISAVDAYREHVWHNS